MLDSHKYDFFIPDKSAKCTYQNPFNTSCAGIFQNVFPLLRLPERFFNEQLPQN